MSHWIVAQMMIDARYQALRREAEAERLAKSRRHPETRVALGDGRAVRPASNFDGCCADSASAA